MTTHVLIMMVDRHRIKRVLRTLCLSMGLVTTMVMLPMARAADSEEVTKMVQDRYTALGEMQFDTFVAPLDDNVQRFFQSSRLTGRVVILGELKRSYPLRNNYQCSVSEIQPHIEGPVAWLTYIVKESWDAGAPPFDVHHWEVSSLITEVLKKTTAGWKVIHYHQSYQEGRNGQPREGKAGRMGGKKGGAAKAGAAY